MARLRGCFGSLSAGEEQVLTLRAGLGGGAPRTVAQVAGELGIGRGEVRSTQRRALRRLRKAARSSGCAGARGGSGAPRTMVSFGTQRVGLAALLNTAAPLVPSERLRGGKAVGGVEASGAGNEAKPTDSGAPWNSGVGGLVGARKLTAASGGSDVPVLPLALAAALALIVLAPLAAKRRRGAAGVATAAPAGPAAWEPPGPAGQEWAAPGSAPAAPAAPDDASAAAAADAPPAPAGDAAPAVPGATSTDGEPDGDGTRAGPEQETAAEPTGNGGIIGSATQRLRDIARRGRNGGG